MSRVYRHRWGRWRLLLDTAGVLRLRHSRFTLTLSPIPVVLAALTLAWAVWAWHDLFRDLAPLVTP